MILITARQTGQSSSQVLSKFGKNRVLFVHYAGPVRMTSKPAQLLSPTAATTD